jgi:hypothetical protein
LYLDLGFCSEEQRDTIVQAVDEILQPEGVEALDRITGGLADYNEQVCLGVTC